MRPTVFFLASAATALAASTFTSPSAAQDTLSRRDREVIVRGPSGFRYYGGVDDRDRAALGVSLAPSRGRADTLGVRVLDVDDKGPAAKAGIEEGDRIVSIDGTALRVDPADADDPMFSDLGSRRLQRALSRHKPGDEVTLVVQRGRESRTVRVKTVAAADLEGARAFAIGPSRLRLGEYGSARDYADSARARAERRPALGISVGTTGTKRDTLGLFVNRVAPDGPAEKAGITEGARVASINGVDVRLSRDDVDDPEFASLRARRFTRELEKHNAGDDIALRVWQNGAYRTVTVKAAKAGDVYKGRRGFAFSFGDGDGTFVMPAVPPMLPMPPMPPMSPMQPMAPMPPMAPFAIEATTLPRMRALAPSRATTFAPLARARAMTLMPRAVVAPRVRRIVEM